MKSWRLEFLSDGSDLKLIKSKYSIIVKKLSRTIFNLVSPTAINGGTIPENKIRQVFYFFEQYNPSILEFEQAIFLINSFNSSDIIRFEFIEFDKSKYNVNISDNGYEKSYFCEIDKEMISKIQFILAI